MQRKSMVTHKIDNYQLHIENLPAIIDYSENHLYNIMLSDQSAVITFRSVENEVLGCEDIPVEIFIGLSLNEFIHAREILFEGSHSAKRTLLMYLLGRE